MSKKLTLKQEAAIQEYMKNGGNQTAAYKHAYNAEKMQERTIISKASVLFGLPHIKARLQELKDELAEENKIDKNWVITQLRNVIEKSSEAEAVTDKEGNLLYYKYDSTGVNKAIDTLNKMLGYYAPVKEEHTVESTQRIIKLNPTKKEE
jgi:phage terminase small subunit